MTATTRTAAELQAIAERFRKLAGDRRQGGKVERVAWSKLATIYDRKAAAAK